MIGTGVWANGRRSYACGIALTWLAALLTLWTTVVRDDGNGLGSIMLVLAAGVGGFAARFRPAGMARAMLGIAVMQVLLGIALATAPSVANSADGPLRIWVSSGMLAAMWLASAAFFRAAAGAGTGD